MRFLRCAAVVASVSGCAWSQTTTGSVLGRVTDASGSSVRGASVTLTNLANNQAEKTTTGEQGDYTFPLIPPGAYRVVVEAAGFKQFSRDFTLEVDQKARVDVPLSVGQLTESVTVTGEAVLLESDSSSLGQVIQSRQVADLPLNGRNPFSLASLTPGVTPLGGFGIGLTGGRGAVIFAGANNFQSDGGLSGNNEILLDGVPITVCCQGQPALIPSIDVVEEFKVQTNVSAAEYGRTSGAILNIVTKSGTNKLHGTAYEFLRNEKLDANNFFSNRAGRPPIPGRSDLRPPLRYNQFGFSIGGPVAIPKVYNGADKTFFSGGFERVFLRRGVFGTFTVPTAAMRAGDFSASPGDVYDPSTTAPDPNRPGQFLRSPFANRMIPSARFNNVALNILKLYPLPVRPGIVNNFDAVASQPDNDRQGNVRLDHYFSDRVRSFARFSLSDDDHYEPNYWGTIASPGGFNQFLTAKTFVWDNVVTISPKLVANFRYGFAWQTNYRDPFSLGVDLNALGFPQSFTSQLQERFLPAQSITGFDGPSETGNQRWSRYTHAAAASVTSIRGRHTLKAGWDGRLFRDHNSQVFNPSGQFSYGTTFTNGPDPRGPVVSGASPYLAFASYLIGLPTSGLHQFQDATSLQFLYSGFYAQDDWKITPKLTLNLGLRFDIETGPTERYNRITWFDPNAPNPLAQASGLPLKGSVRFAGRDGNPRQRWETATGWGPRAGFAYQFTPKTVLRGGYGIFYLPTIQRIFISGNPGFTVDNPFVATIDGVTPVGSISNPYPNGLNHLAGAATGALTGAGTSVGANLYNTPLSYVQQWNLDVQRELGGNLVIDAAYAGNHGLRLPISPNRNALNTVYYGSIGDANRVAQLNGLVDNPFFGLIQTGPLATSKIQANQLLRQFPQYTGLTEQVLPIGSNIYHSLQLRAQKRMSAGISAMAAYTLSKNIGNVNNLTTGFLDTGSPGYQYDLDLHNERSLLPSDIPQRFAGTFVWDLPFGRGRAIGKDAHGLLGQLIGGWQINGIVTFQSGFPLTLSAAGLPPYAGSRPSRVPGVRVITSGAIVDRIGGVSTPTKYMDPAAFRPARSFEFGDTPRLMPDLRGPGIRNLDFSLFKNFPIGEQARVQLRAEAFNATNTVRFGNPGTTLGTPGFGVIGGQANSPRQIQLAAKLIF